MKHIPMLLFYLFAIVSCKNESNIQWCDLNASEDASCVNGADLSPTALAEMVLGTWTLRAKGCGFCTGPFCEEITPNALQEVTFTTDGRIITADDAGNTINGTYQIVLMDGKTRFSATISTEIPRFSRICSGSILVDDSRPADGPLFIFEKTD